MGLQPLLDEFLLLVGVVESAHENPSKNFLRALEALEQALAGTGFELMTMLIYERPL